MEKEIKNMNFIEFLGTLENDHPDSELSPEIRALWWTKKGNWEIAHQIAQDAGTKQGDWIHAHLHRIEGDLSNASYWYSRAGKPNCQTSLPEEWESLVKDILNQ